MRRGFLAVLTLVAALPAAAQNDPGPPPPPELPPHFMCSVMRQGPLGEVGVQQLVNMDGAPDTRLDSWSTVLAPGGVAIDASWDHPDPASYSLVWISQSDLEPDRSYRIRVQRDRPGDERAMFLESPLTRPEDGRIIFFTRWELLTAMLVGATHPRILVIRDDGAVVRSDAIDPAVFARVLAATMPLQAEMDAKLARYRSDCPHSEGGPIVPPVPVVQVPG